MDVRARSWITMLVLALALSVGSATAASGQAPGGCGTPATPATPADPTPGSPGATPATPAIPADPAQCAPGPDGVLGTADDVAVLAAGAEGIPVRADTGAGGTAGRVSGGTLALVAGGLLALVAAVTVRRRAPSRRA